MPETRYDSIEIGEASKESAVTPYLKFRHLEGDLLSKRQ